MSLLDSFDYETFKKMNLDELTQLCDEIRALIINTVSQKGGHLSSNLGVVELTVALHHYFNFPTDKIIFDVGHQCYTHKILTNRKDAFVNSLRQFGGLSGYQKLCEGPYDCYEAGHSSTAISAGVGMAIARDLNHDSYNVISFVGDGAIVSGMSLEAINHLGNIPNKLIIILNDNEMSISRPVGTLAQHMSKLHRRMVVMPSKDLYRKITYKLPFGNAIFNKSRSLKNRIKRFFLEKTLFETFNLEYLGPINGHNIKELEKTFATAAKMDKSVVIHVLTKKGKGYSYAENDQVGSWHGVDPFDIATGKKKTQKPENMISWSALASNIAYQIGKENEDVVFITPAMVSGSAMNDIFRDFPERSFDVGIAEEHSATFASGLAISGKKPYLAIYSTFLQRAYDQINHDISRMNLGVVFGIDRAGIVGQDGETHQGIFDVAFTKDLPNSIIAMPKDASDACQIYKTAFSLSTPFFIRIPRADVLNRYDFAATTVGEVGKWDVKEQADAQLNLIVTGPYYHQVEQLCEEQHYPVNLIFARYYKPIDEFVLTKLVEKPLPTIIVDIYADEAGLFDSISHFLSKQQYDLKLISFTLPNVYIPSGKMAELLEFYQRDSESLKHMIEETIKHGKAKN